MLCVWCGGLAGAVACGFVLLRKGRLSCSLEKLKSSLNLIKNKFKLLLTMTEFSYIWAGHFFALISVPTSKYYFKMWQIWISLICFLLSAFAKVNNSSPTSHQERVKSRREEAQRVLLPIWLGKQNVSMSQIGAGIVLLPFWAWLYHWKSKALFKTCQHSLWSLERNILGMLVKSICCLTEKTPVLPAVRLFFFF